MTFLGIVVCQVGTAFAARTEYASLRAVGVFGNRLLLWGIAFELAFAAAVVHRPPLQHVFDTAPVGAAGLLYLLPLPFLVWAPTSCAASCGGGRPAQVLLPKSRNTR